MLAPLGRVGIGNYAPLTTDDGSIHIGSGTGIVNSTYYHSRLLVDDLLNSVNTNDTDSFAAIFNLHLNMASTTKGTGDRVAQRIDLQNNSTSISGIGLDVDVSSTGATGNIYGILADVVHPPDGIGGGMMIAMEPGVRNKRLSSADPVSGAATWSTNLWLASHTLPDSLNAVGSREASSGITFAGANTYGGDWLYGLYMASIGRSFINMRYPAGNRDSDSSPTKGYAPPQTRTITGATNATPIVITVSAAHGLTTYTGAGLPGTCVYIKDVGGNTAANGYWWVTVVDDTHFSLQGSIGDGEWTSGGTVHYTTAFVFGDNATTTGINVEYSARWKSVLQIANNVPAIYNYDSGPGVVLHG